jgi:hypothetical protein
VKTFSSILCYLGGLRSPLSQPTDSDFIGSVAMVAIWTWSHWPHSKLLTSKPFGPCAIRASDMRDWHFGQRGRSIAVSDGPDK